MAKIDYFDMYKDKWIYPHKWIEI